MELKRQLQVENVAQVLTRELTAEEEAIVDQGNFEHVELKELHDIIHAAGDGDAVAAAATAADPDAAATAAGAAAVPTRTPRTTITPPGLRL